MAEPTNRPQGTSLLQVLILILLGVVLYLVLQLQFTMREIAQEEPLKQMQAQIESPVIDLGIAAKILKIDSEKQTVEIERKRRGTGDRVKQTILFSADTVITIAGQPGKLADLKEGMNIRYRGTIDEEGLTATKRVTAQPPVPN